MWQCPALTLSRSRPGFSELLDRIEGNHVRTVIVEDASRFARELMAQELGITLLISRGVRLLTASGDDLMAFEDTKRRIMMRQIAGAFAQYEKAGLVHKLRHARERKKEATGKCDGRKSHKELRPEVVKEAKRLRRAIPTIPTASNGAKFGRPAVVSQELKARIEALRSEGSLTAGQIGERLGVSRRTIYRALAA